MHESIRGVRGDFHDIVISRLDKYDEQPEIDEIDEIDEFGEFDEFDEFDEHLNGRHDEPSVSAGDDRRRRR